MSEFRVNADMFGRYCKIETGFDREKHIYKIVCALKSNSYCDLPLGTSKTKETHHNEIVPVLRVIHCGVCEDKVEKVALSDVELIKAENPVYAAGGCYCSECEDCRMDICYCNRFKKYMNETDFCSRGKKRGNIE